MSHEHYEKLEYKTPEEIRSDQIRHLREEASRQLYREGKIGFCGTDQDFRDRDEKVSRRMSELAKDADTSI